MMNCFQTLLSTATFATTQRQIVFDVYCPPDLRRVAAARVLWTKWRAYMLRKSALRAILSAHDTPEVI